LLKEICTHFSQLTTAGTYYIQACSYIQALTKSLIQELHKVEAKEEERNGAANLHNFPTLGGVLLGLQESNGC
jgi:hypothetical protein